MTRERRGQYFGRTNRRRRLDCHRQQFLSTHFRREHQRHRQRIGRVHLQPVHQRGNTHGHADHRRPYGHRDTGGHELNRAGSGDDAGVVSLGGTVSKTNHVDPGEPVRQEYKISVSKQNRTHCLTSPAFGHISAQKNLF
jgi:hypothetical protein